MFVPKGFITTKEAVARLFKARHAHLVSSEPERAAEQRRLQSLKDLSSFPPARPLGKRPRKQPEFSPVHKRRLKRLDAIEQEANSLQTIAAIEVRTALAEGDLSAILQLDSGDQKPIKQSRWRAADGLSVVWSARDRMALPIHPSFAVGTVLIAEEDLAGWSIGAPKKASNIDVSVIAQDAAPNTLTTDRAPAAANAPSDARRRPVADATFNKWYCDRRDQWPTDRKHPSQDEDLADARGRFPANRVTREAIRAVRSQHALPSWTAQGRRKLAQK